VGTTRLTSATADIPTRDEGVVGPLLEEKFTEEELKQLVAWHENPVKKRYEAAGPEMQNAMVQKLLADAAPVLDPKLKALQEKMAGTLRTASGGAPAVQNIVTASVSRYGSSGRTTVPNGVSVVSRRRFMSADRRPGTYQLSASDSTRDPHRSRTWRNLTTSVLATRRRCRCSGAAGLSAFVTRCATMRGCAAR